MPVEAGFGRETLSASSLVWSSQSNLQLRFLFFAPLGPSDEAVHTSVPLPTAMVTARSKISCTPLISLLLHSRYVAPILRATVAPCSGVTGVSPCVFSRSMQVRLVRRSDLRPTRMTGVVGQKCKTSGYHFRSSVSFSLATKFSLDHVPIDVPCP